MSAYKRTTSVMRTMSAHDAVDGSSTGTRVPWMWVLPMVEREFFGAPYLLRMCEQHRTFTDREVGSDLRAVLSGSGVNGLKENSVCFEHIWIGKMFDLREKVMPSVNRAPSEIMQFPIRKPYLICWTIEFAEHSFLPTERIG